MNKKYRAEKLLRALEDLYKQKEIKEFTCDQFLKMYDVSGNTTMTVVLKENSIVEINTNTTRKGTESTRLTRYIHSSAPDLRLCTKLITLQRLKAKEYNKSTTKKDSSAQLISRSLDIFNSLEEDFNWYMFEEACIQNGLVSSSTKFRTLKFLLTNKRIQRVSKGVYRKIAVDVKLKELEKSPRLLPIEEEIIKKLPEIPFSFSKYRAICSTLFIHKSTSESYLRRFIDQGLVTKYLHGVYIQTRFLEKEKFHSLSETKEKEKEKIIEAPKSDTRVKMLLNTLQELVKAGGERSCIEDYLLKEEITEAHKIGKRLLNLGLVTYFNTKREPITEYKPDYRLQYVGRRLDYLVIKEVIDSVKQTVTVQPVVSVEDILVQIQKEREEREEYTRRVDQLTKLIEEKEKFLEIYQTLLDKVDTR